MNLILEKFEQDLCKRDIGKSQINRGQARELRCRIGDLLREGGMQLVRSLMEDSASRTGQPYDPTLQAPHTPPLEPGDTPADLVPPGETEDQFKPVDPPADSEGEDADATEEVEAEEPTEEVEEAAPAKRKPANKNKRRR